MFKPRKERTVRRTLQNAYDIFSLYEEYTGNRLKGMNPLLQVLLMFYLLEVSIDKIIRDMTDFTNIGMILLFLFNRS